MTYFWELLFVFTNNTYINPNPTTTQPQPKLRFQELNSLLSKEPLSKVSFFQKDEQTFEPHTQKAGSACAVAWQFFGLRHSDVDVRNGLKSAIFS